ncbi:MAG: hypothetical protein Ct9H300mP22_7340 [Gammaproteobacteria bacterium]|nr:MAG: hypothetical protein Ct9H300mP22_7340 [Gammaproteobacteria bacterium]
MFVGDRSNNRVQILDQDLNFLDDWRHFGRPSGITVLEDGTLVVADSESGVPIPGPAISPEGFGENGAQSWLSGRHSNWASEWFSAIFCSWHSPGRNGRRNLGNIFAGLTSGCDLSPSGGCLQKWVLQ